MDTKSEIAEYSFISWGGLGDTLLMTPLFRYLSENGNQVFVLATDKKYYEVLVNNPHIKLELFEGNANSIDIKNYLRPCYSNLLPSMFFKDTHASNLISRMLGFELTNTIPVIQTTKDEDAEVRNFIALNNINKLITINPFTDDNPNKEWDILKWEYLIEELKKIGYTVIQLGREDHPRIRGVEFNAPYTIRFSFGLIKFSDYFIGIDSLLAHASTALQTKSIVLFGPTAPGVWGHQNNINLYSHQVCSPCVDILFRIKCPFGKKCMNNIDIPNVLINIKQDL